MTNAPLFSIITITKNDPVGFARTRESLIEQSCQNFEWIVVDGNQENDNGIYNAMNKGLTRTNGDYILFMNGGDMLASPEILEMVAHQIQIRPADFLYGDVYEDQHYLKAKSWKKIHKGMITSHQAMFYKREKLNGLTFNENLMIAGDYEFTCRFLKQVNSVFYMIFAIAITEPGGISQQRQSQGRKEEWIVRRTVLKKNKLSCCMIYLRQSLAAFVRNFAPALFYAAR
jgi:putative colanic acid biosynthesis glycosyltransferase